MKILIGCEESQVVTIAFRKKGHEAYSCDLQPCSGGHPEWHIQGDAIAELYSGKYDMAICHPPCTFISIAGARWMYLKAGVLNNDRYKKAMEAKEFFMMCLNAPVPYIAVENPQPLKIVGLPPATTYVQPFEFGHPFSKKTLLWLKGLPPLMPTERMAEYKPYLPSNTGGAKRGQKFQNKRISQKERSKTFSGIARAMAEQWG
jgi:hypothetical protein